MEVEAVLLTGQTRSVGSVMRCPAYTREGAKKRRGVFPLTSGLPRPSYFVQVLAIRDRKRPVSCDPGPISICCNLSNDTTILLPLAKTAGSKSSTGKMCHCRILSESCREGLLRCRTYEHLAARACCGRAHISVSTSPTAFFSPTGPTSACSRAISPRSFAKSMK